MTDHQSIRPFLERLAHDGEMLRIPDAVNPAYELVGLSFAG